MKTIIEDLFATINRLNKELDERTAFEHKLMDVIEEKTEQIEELQTQLNTYVNIEQHEKMKKEIQTKLNTETILNNALTREPLVQPKDLTKEGVN